MKKPLLLLIYVCGMVCTGWAQTPVSPHAPSVHTPGPTYPTDALKAKVTGLGTCEVVFNASEHVEQAMMIKSTGSKILDDNTVNFAQKNWTGKANTRVSVPIEYKLAPEMTKGKRVVHLSGSQPPYPFEARAAHTEGSGIIKVSFDETGKVVEARMSKSTGSDLLDQNTIKYVTDTWHIDNGRKCTKFIPITYRLE